MTKRIVISAGDPSGDQHAANVVRSLRTKESNFLIAALGGPYLKEVADEWIYSLVGVGGFGFFEPLFKIPEYFRIRALLKNYFQTNRPDAVLLVDYYGFNIHIARMAHTMGIPVLYYISPQVWASRPARIQELKQVIRKMMVIFPFEETLYQKNNISVQFVGHPLLDQLPAPGTPLSGIQIGLFPGSRQSVLKRHMPIMIDAAKKIHTEFPESHFYLFHPAAVEKSFYQPYLVSAPHIQLVEDKGYAIRQGLRFAITVSGTASLENMLLGIPMVVMYKLSWITYTIAKALIRVRFVALPNILADKMIIPELLQDRANSKLIADTVIAFLKNAKALDEQRDALLNLRAILSHGGASDAVADEIHRVIYA